MNVALLMMSSAWIAGGDPAVCIDCAQPAPTICDACTVTGVPGLLARLKAKLPGGDGIGCLPSGGIFAKLKAKLQMPEPSVACSPAAGVPSPCASSATMTMIGAPIIGTCHLPPVPGALPAEPTPTPKEMPKPDAPKNDAPKAMPKPAVEPIKDGKSEAVLPAVGSQVVPAGARPAVPF